MIEKSIFKDGANKNLTHPKTQKGITLIALITTIVVLLIIAGVAVTSITKYDIIENANNAKEKYAAQLNKENTTLSTYNTIIDQYIEILNGGVESCVGCYADIDNDGKVDGVIFADLAFSKKGQWNDENGVYGAYSYERKDTLNEYTIRDAKETEKVFKGAKNKVVAPTTIDKVEENDRFYVMALEDFTVGEYSEFYWYYNLMMDNSYTKGGFGTGRENTHKVIEKVGTSLHDKDIWKCAKENIENGWFIPSISELAAFADVFSSYYTENGFKGQYYWSSSQQDSVTAWMIVFNNKGMYSRFLDQDYCVRLCTTF